MKDSQHNQGSHAGDDRQSNSHKGFAAMPKSQVREIARKGGESGGRKKSESNSKRER